MAKPDENLAQNTEETSALPEAPPEPPANAVGRRSDKQKQPAESMYSAADLAAAAYERFGVAPEVVTVAMKEAKKDSATPTEAEQIVKKFLGRKVK